MYIVWVRRSTGKPKYIHVSFALGVDYTVCVPYRPERSLDLCRAGEDLDKDSHVKVDVAGEERENVAPVAVGVGLQTR